MKRLAYLALGAVLALFGNHYFTGSKEPDLQRLYMQSMAVEDQPPVVFIHGILGSRLKDENTDEELWFGPLWNLLFDHHYDLVMGINPGTLEAEPGKLKAFAIADNTAGKDYYGNVLRTLEEVGGYEKAMPGQEIRPQSKYFYEFYYDWRLDNAINAAHLANFIDRIRLDHGAPDLKVDIIAHSMGGLIARYYIRYGRADVLDSNDFPVTMYGGERVRRVILLGTPNLGSVKILNAFIDGIQVGFRKINTEILVTMPSMFQLLPHPINNWIVTAEGAPLDRDIFDVNMWRRFKWSIFDEETRARILSRYDKRRGR